MFQSVQPRRRERESAAAVDIAPLIDIVFILLIFFLVTTTFVRDRGIAVTRPAATHAQALPPEALRVHLTAAGRIFVDGTATDEAQVAARVRTFLNRHPDAAVTIVPDEQATSKQLVDLMDEVKAGGATDIAVATRRRGAG